jgi:hypothetical protein
MSTQNSMLERTDYGLVLLLPDSGEVLAKSDGTSYRLPHVSIPKWTRPAEQLQMAIHAVWGLHVIILDFPQSPEGFPLCAVAQVLSSHDRDALIAISMDELRASEISQQQRGIVQAMLAGDTGERGPFSRIGWIDEAIQWIESEIPSSTVLTDDIQQYNASGTFALVRFPMRDGSAYWLKATGAPNAHELAVTVALSELCPEYLPPLIAVLSDWNAWLMKEAGHPLEAAPQSFVLEQSAVALAQLQMRTVGLGAVLLAVGVADQRITVFHEHSLEVLDYLEEAMAQQTSTKVPRLERQRLSEIGLILQDACLRMEDLGIPDTVIHGDINCGNILFDGARCRFIDWSEGYTGNPFVTFQHLLLLNNGEQQETNALCLKEAYKRCWMEYISPAQIDAAFTLMPLLAIASYLYGRGDWLRSSPRNDPQRQSYIRSLARHMDRAAQQPALRAALCH